MGVTFLLVPTWFYSPVSQQRPDHKVGALSCGGVGVASGGHTSVRRNPAY